MELLHKFAQPYISHFLFLSCLLDPPKTCNFVKLIKPCYFLTGLFWDAVDSHGFAGLFDGVYYIFTGESTCKADKLTIFARCLEIRIKRPVTVFEQTPRKKGCKFGGGLEDEPHPMSPAHKGQQTPDLRCATTRRLHIELCLWPLFVTVSDSLTPTLSHSPRIPRTARSHCCREREPQPEVAVSFRNVVTFVTWLISRTEFSSLELVL